MRHIVNIALDENTHNVLAEEATRQNRSTRAHIAYLLDQVAAGIVADAKRAERAMKRGK